MQELGSPDWSQANQAADAVDFPRSPAVLGDKRPKVGSVTLSEMLQKHICMFPVWLATGS